MKYQNINTNEIKTYSEIRKLTPNVSYPRNSDTMGEWKKIASTPQPNYNPDTHKLEELEPVKARQVWRVVPLSQAEKDTKKSELDEHDWISYKKEKDNAEKQAWLDAGKPAYQ